ncbi:hypothetical protein RI367_007565 [Sorochytrium milnesiophthora]
MDDQTFGMDSPMMPNETIEGEQDTLAKKPKLVKVIVDNPTLDLDAYATLHKGYTRIHRLIFIGERCPQLADDALRMAVAQIKEESLDTKLYQDALAKLNSVRAANHRPAEDFDVQWAETAQRTARVKGDKLEAELKTYKNNCIKESIRIGHNYLGDHYYQCGQLHDALKCYSRTRDYCSTPLHIVDMCLKVIRISIELESYVHAHSYVSKAESVGELPLDPAARNVIKAKLNCASAIAYLESNQYKRVARLLLDTPFELGDTYSELIAPNDVAIYGGLCALASFDRADLKSKAIDNPTFKQFLELEPHIREMLHSFYSSRYSICMELLERHKPDFLLDMYLSPHIEELYRSIRNKALVQYFSPFSSVDMHKMASAFAVSVPDLEREVSALIEDGSISARIDSHNKVLKAKQVDVRSQMMSKAMDAGATFQRRASHALLHMNMVSKGFVVKTGGGHGA